MNKKFFAALASATMAFTASGSIAVFADDFVEESNIVNPGDVKPDHVEEKVVWNEENFGELAKLTGNNTVFTGLGKVVLTPNEEVKTADLANVTAINLTGVNGEIKGLEYFTKLGSFDDTVATAVTNEVLDFSANTKLKTLTVNNAKGLVEITLPKAFVNEKEEEVYSLATLDVKGTKLTSLDLTAQETLFEDGSITLSGNKNLKDVTLKTATAATSVELDTLDLSGNALETVNLDNYTIDTLNLNGNHIGALNLSKTTATKATLGTQTFYVYEKAANVNLKEAFAELDVDYVKATKDAFDSETGVLDLGKATTYTYETSLKKGAPSTLSVKLNYANPMNRLYNPNSGEHFYTADVKEKAALVDLGWKDEGYGWVAPTEATGKTSKTPVFRLYNPNAGDHHYTMSAEERDVLKTFGWKDENVGWYSATTTDKVAVYRQYNPYANGAGSHNYTTDKAENNYLVSLGWIYEGTAWYGLK